MGKIVGARFFEGTETITVFGPLAQRNHLHAGTVGYRTEPRVHPSLRPTCLSVVAGID